ncbi:alpha/beta hydrolase family protein [Kitasatospora sp. NPDC050543]|uniref:alpha/beta hydrolase family protein n=1 Tax=Kitasatospora sp. NPDC050543 TaxID=3364054 RepID=UPI0037BD32B2
MNTTRRAAVSVALALGLSLPLVGAGASTAFATPSSLAATDSTAAAPADPTGARLALPRPSGPHPVGRDTLHLVDRSRTDPWVPAAGPRELMVSMYYPARPGTGGPARYLSTEEARLLLEDRGLAEAVPATTLSATRTNARDHAPPVPGRFPLVVLSPGFSVSRATLTVLAEDLASRGYVVAAVDHAYESVGTEFPGGRVLTCAACEKLAEVGRPAIAAGRAKDVSFLLDRLTGRHPDWRLARMIDPDRIGMAGHSMGGMATAATMIGDPRVRAGADLDGPTEVPIPADGLGRRPFLLLGTESEHSPGGPDTSWDRDWRRLDGWKRWLTVAGAGHFSFTDLPMLGSQLGLNDPTEPLPGPRAGQITTAYVGAFFDLHLRGIPQPLLSGASSGNPEVVFRNA